LVPILGNMPTAVVDIDELRRITKNGADSVVGEHFGDILSVEGEPAPSWAGVAAEQELVIPGGNPVQPGGKDLPGRSTAGPETVMFATTDPMFAAYRPEQLPSAESLPLEKAELSATADDQTATTVVYHSTSATADPLATVLADQAATVNVDEGSTAPPHPLISAMSSRFANVSTADTAAQIPTSEAAAISAAAIDLNALSKLSAPLDAPEQRLRADVPPSGQTGSAGSLDADLLSRGTGTGARVDAPALPGATMGVREGVSVETSELITAPETTPLKQLAIAQAQPVTGSIGPPVADTGASAALKMSAPATMTMPLGDPQWNNELAGRVSVMVKNGLSEASLQLSPPELGRLEIRISTEGDQAKIQFTVQSIDAKEAIELAMPRLREMLEQAGLQLAHSEVADHSQSRQGEGHVSGPLSDQTTAEMDEALDEPVTEFAVSTVNSLVDYYV